MADSWHANGRQLTILPAIPPGQGLLEGPDRLPIERAVLLPFLLQQRWFGGKARQPRTAQIIDWAPLTSGVPGPVLSLVDVTYADRVERYQLPLAIVSGEAAERLLAERPEAVLARVPDSAPRLLCDGLVDDFVCRTIFAAARRGGRFPARTGAVVGRPIETKTTSAELDLEIARFASTYSNTAIALGGRYLLKVFRRVESGLHPEIEIGSFLARSGGTVRVPALIGSVEYVATEGTPAALAMVQELVASRMTGWDYAVEQAEGFLRRVEGAGAPAGITHELTDAFAGFAGILGRRTAELHRALAGDPTNPAFAPERASEAELPVLMLRLRGTVEATLELLAGHRESFRPDATRLAARVLGSRRRLIQRIDRLGAAIQPFIKFRIHGDYHLGQVLHADGDVVILDFEGEPAKPLVERRAKQSPLRDIAGMVRSFSYCAHVALTAAAGGDRVRRAALGPSIDRWAQSASTAFLQGYHEVADNEPLLSCARPELEALLEIFLLDKAMYELQYEMNNRPDWVHIPLAGLLALLQRGDPR